MGRIVIYCINVNVFSGSVFRNNIFSGSCISSYSLIIHLVCSRTFSLYLLQNLDIYYFITCMDFFFFFTTLPTCFYDSSLDAWFNTCIFKLVFIQDSGFSICYVVIIGFIVPIDRILSHHYSDFIQTVFIHFVQVLHAISS